MFDDAFVCVSVLLFDQNWCVLGVHMIVRQGNCFERFAFFFFFTVEVLRCCAAAMTCVSTSAPFQLIKLVLSNWVMR